MSERCAVHRLGTVAYEDAWHLQERLAAEIASGERLPSLLLLEHPHTYTFGRSGHPENLLWDEAERQCRGVTVHWVDRGGDVTYHGPGQLVGYPLLPLAQDRLFPDPQTGSPHLPQADYVGYLRLLEATLILALSNLGVVASQIQGLTGVWVQPQDTSLLSAVDPAKVAPAKIAAIGIKVDVRGVSRHGFALNVAPDMVYWDGIIGCGLQETPVTSLAELLSPVPSLQEVSDKVVEAFAQIFGFEMIERPLNEL